MNKKTDIAIVDKEYLEDKIYVIRGQKVMLDRDLAVIYGYSTKAFNQQIKNNIEKFERDFMFKLTAKEAYASRSKKLTLKNDDKRGSNIKYLPYAFTESGIYMLMTVLKGPLATKQSIALIRLFRSMKDYLVENKDLITNKELDLRTTILENNVKNINTNLDNVNNCLNKVMENFNDPSTYKHFLILDGKKIEADLAYIKIFKLAKKSIYYIDDYIDIKTLDLLSNVRKNVNITIFSDNKSNKPLKEYMIQDFIKQNPNNKIKLIKTDNKCHDRYIIIDHNSKNEMVFHSGASLKDVGNKITTITRIEEVNIYKHLINKMLKRSSLRLC